MARPALCALALSASLALASCSSSSDETMPAGTTDQGGGGASGQAGQAGSSGEAGASGAGGAAGAKAEPHPCVSTFGSSMSEAYGRIDGTLYSAVIPPDQSCTKPNADHLILEVAMNGEYYRLLINVQSDLPGQDPRVQLAMVDGPPLPGGAFSEGWHTSNVTIDYPSTFPVHADAFTPYELDAAVKKVMDELAYEFDQPVSVYLLGYGPDGGHKIHRNGKGHDGAVVIHPRSEKPRYVLFRFANQDF